MLIDLFLKREFRRLADEFPASEEDSGFDLIENSTVGSVVGYVLDISKIGLGLFQKECFGFGGGVEFGRNVLASRSAVHGNLKKNIGQEITNATHLAQSRSPTPMHPFWSA